VEKKIKIIPDRPSKKDFMSFDIWCPYQYPWELDELKIWGVSDYMINKSVLDIVSKKHGHPCYSIPRHFTFRPRDLLYVAVKASFPKIDKAFFGYIVLSDCEASTLGIFYFNKELIFYNDPADVGDNIEALNILSHTVSEPVAWADISPVHEMKEVKIPVGFCIPTCEQE
jgi:hypothetical protein